MTTGRQAAEHPVREARSQGERAARSKTFDRLARAGFVARGLIYGIIGVLALKLALGDGGKATNQQGALRTIAHQPFGRVLVTLVAIGLGGYALWRFARAALGTGDGDSAFDRIASAASGGAYAILCVTAVKIVSGANTSNSGNARKPTGGVLGWSHGTLLVGAAGVVLMGVGLYQGWKGLSRDFLEDSKTERMSPRGKHAFELLGVAGHLARMVVFALAGWFLLRAAIDYNPDKAVGVDGALAKLATTTSGPLLLGIVAAGLIAFAAYSLADARYRRI